MQSAAASRLEAASRSASCDASVRAAVLLPASCVALRLLLRGAVLLSGSCNDEAAAGVEAAGSSICTTKASPKQLVERRLQAKITYQRFNLSSADLPASLTTTLGPKEPCKNVPASLSITSQDLLFGPPSRRVTQRPLPVTRCGVTDELRGEARSVPRAGASRRVRSPLTSSHHRLFLASRSLPRSRRLLPRTQATASGPRSATTCSR